jgi:hypothetical protein
MKPLAKKQIQQSFITSHPLEHVNDRNNDLYEKSIKKTIRDYFDYFDNGEISQFPLPTDQKLIDRIYRKFRNKEYSEYRAYLISKIPLEKVLAFAQHDLVSDVRNWGPWGKQMSQHIQSQNISTELVAVKNMIDYLKKN